MYNQYAVTIFNSLRGDVRVVKYDAVSVVVVAEHLEFDIDVQSDEVISIVKIVD